MFCYLTGAPWIQLYYYLFSPHHVFLQTTGVHVWFVAHPRQLRDWKGQAPNLYDISGSAHFINKADNGIVVHRDRDPESTVQHKVGRVGWMGGDRWGG